MKNGALRFKVSWKMQQEKEMTIAKSKLEKAKIPVRKQKIYSDGTPEGMAFIYFKDSLPQTAAKFWADAINKQDNDFEAVTKFENLFQGTTVDVYYANEFVFKGSSEHGFKMRRLSKTLRKLTNKIIPGVTESQFSIGTEGSAAATHTEDCNLPSANYHIMGAIKYWFVHPPSEFEKIEKFLRTCEVSPTCPNIAGHKNVLLDPQHLAKLGIVTYSISQKPGEFVVTSPAAHHSVWNCGGNFNEAINLRLPIWDANHSVTKLPCAAPCEKVTKEGIIPASTHIETKENMETFGFERWQEFNRHLYEAIVEARKNVEKQPESDESEEDDQSSSDSSSSSDSESGKENEPAEQNNENEDNERPSLQSTPRRDNAPAAEVSSFQKNVTDDQGDEMELDEQPEDPTPSFSGTFFLPY